MNTEARAQPDHNSLGKAAFIVGLIGLILAFVPLIGFVSWFLGPAALLLGALGAFRPKRAMAITGLCMGALTLVVCFWWINTTRSVGEAMSADTFNTTGKAASLADAPIVDATISGLWQELEDNKVAAGQKYGGRRLRFTNEKIEDFAGDAANPAMSFVGKSDEYLTYSVSASFASADGARIGALRKGQDVSFVCETISEGFMDGYGLGNCKLVG